MTVTRKTVYVLLALALAVVLTFAAAAPLGAQTSNGGYAGMFVDQTPTVVNVGDTFTCNVMVTYSAAPPSPVYASTSIPVTDAEAHINFDPTKVEVLGITPGTFLPNVLQSDFNNVAGTIDFSASSLNGLAGLGAPYQFLLCSLELKAKKLTSGTPLQFVFLGPYRITDVKFFSQSILNRSQVFNGNVIVQSQGPRPVPSVCEWGAIGMGTVMAGMLVWRLRRRTASL